MLAHLAEALGDTQSAVRIGKTAIGRGMNLMYYAYPVHRLPAYTPLRRPPETAFILGIARQESEFNISTLSGAGARGILQVMPITARHICRDYKLKCDIPRLMKDAAYNTMMGSAYIADRMDEFTGSYVLTLAGYNAGPGRAREWIKRVRRSAHRQAWTPSTGSTASRSRRRASTCRRCCPTSRSIARAWARPTPFASTRT